MVPAYGRGQAPDGCCNHRNRGTSTLLGVASASIIVECPALYILRATGHHDMGA